MVRVFSTDAIAPAARSPAWARATRAAFGSLEVLDIRGPLQASLEVTALATARIVALRSTAQRVRRVPRGDELAQTLNVLVQLAGRCRVEHLGRSLWLEPGSFALVDGRRAFELEHEGEFSQRLLQLPRALAHARLPHVDHALGRASSSSHGGDQYVAAHLALVARSAAHVTETGRAQLLEALWSGLATASAFEGSSEVPRTFARALELIELHLHDPAFGPRALVDLLGTGQRRHLEQLFATQGLTISRELWRRRVERADRMLQGPAHGDCTILEIALACGFRSATHFSRVFRAHTGVAPRDRRGR